MKLWDEYISYIKDNPEGYWFKRKLYGYGWTPATKEGWATVGAYVLFLFCLVWYAETTGVLKDEPLKFLALVAAATALLIVVSWKNGEPAKWQWGQKQDDQE